MTIDRGEADIGDLVERGQRLHHQFADHVAGNFGFARAFELAHDAGDSPLDALGVEDFVRILTEPDASLCTQYAALLATEGVTLEFAASGVRRIAEVAFEVNERTENIGARRLHTVMERLLEAVSFEASDRGGASVTIDAAYVDSSLGELVRDQDLTRYIL